MNRRNLLIVIGVFVVVLIMIFFLVPSSKSALEQKTEVFLNVMGGRAVLNAFNLQEITLDDHYFYDEEHPPFFRIHIWLPHEDALIVWHVVDISSIEIQELIDSGEGFTEYIVKNGSNENEISEEIIVREAGEYVVTFRQTNVELEAERYYLKISVVYWGLK